MGETTGISWTDATFNAWWGCTRVSPGCERCYAEQLATVRRKLDVWGVDAQRKPMSEAYWRDPVKWNKRAEAAGVRMRVFCSSMADVFERVPARNIQANAVQDAARPRLFSLIEATPWLDWLLLTKRPENVSEMVPRTWMLGGFPKNVWMGVTAEDQKRADQRVPLLCKLPASIRFVSHEPAVEIVDFTKWLGPISWVITGGESAPPKLARPYSVEWARSIVAQCRTANVFPFVKQLGSRALLAGSPYPTMNHKGDVPGEWPSDIRVQEFPRPATFRMAS